jgi:hypothetical protein
MVCSGNTTIACDDDSICTAANAGTCSAFGAAGANTREDGCKPDSSGICVPSGDGDGEGVCDIGPDDKFCDGVTRANGEGFIACSENNDCAPGTIGIEGGDCTLSKRRECFLSPITAAGVPDPVSPISVATFCIPPTSNGGINAVAGLPGPGRLRNQGLVTTFCASDPNTPYAPGSGGCP